MRAMVEEMEREEAEACAQTQAQTQAQAQAQTQVQAEDCGNLGMAPSWGHEPEPKYAIEN